MTNISGNKSVIADADALIGLVSKEDALHNRCLQISRYFLEKNIITLTPYTIILEAATVLSKILGRSDLAAKLLKDFADIEEKLDTNVSGLVTKLYNPKTSKKNTPFDHYVLALAITNNVRVVFSFDSFYKKHGLILAEELLKN